MKRSCEQHPNQIHYVDCLTMFCGATKMLPGALFGGKAKPQRHFFHRDELHLSNEGYLIWQEVLNHLIQEILYRRETE